MVGLTLGNFLTGEYAARFGAIQTLITWEDPVLGFYWLYSGAESEGTITRTRLIEDQPIANPEVTYVAGMSQVYRPSDMLIRDQGDTVELWVAGQRSAPVVHFDIVREGRLQQQTRVDDIDSGSRMEQVTLGGPSIW